MRLVLAALIALAATAHGQQRPAPPVPAGVKALRDLVYSEPDGRPQKLDLFLPENAPKPWPLVVWVHGGAWKAGSKQDCGALGLTAKGFAVASVEYRFSQVAPFPAQIVDCKAAIRWLRAKAGEYGYDADRIGAWGNSAGGHLVCLLGTAGDVAAFDVGENTNVSSRVQAVCNFYGPTDLPRFARTPGYERGDKPEAPEGQLLGGTVNGKPEAAKAASPVTYATSDDPPFLTYHGTKDPLVPADQAVALDEALKKAGVASEVHLLEGAGHGGPHFGGVEVRTNIIAFFERHLKAPGPTAR